MISQLEILKITNMAYEGVLGNNPIVYERSITLTDGINIINPDDNNFTDKKLLIGEKYNFEITIDFRQIQKSKLLPYYKNYQKNAFLYDDNKIFKIGECNFEYTGSLTKYLEKGKVYCLDLFLMQIKNIKEI